MRFHKLDLNLLVALDALLTHSNISRAAEQLHLTQSAVSAALARLRAYLDDELLVPVGRRMELTPRAQSLREPVRDILVRIRATVGSRPQFDPCNSNRLFTLLVSDYSLETLMPGLVALAERAGGAVSFRLLPLVASPVALLKQGEADMLVVPEAFASPEHPSEELVREELVCVVWSGSEHARRGLTLESYQHAGHVVMEPPSSESQAYDTLQLSQVGMDRRIAVTTYSFASMTSLVEGTQYIATVQRRLAQRMVAARALTILPSPVAMPVMPLLMQWHAFRSEDPGIVWLRAALSSVAMAGAAQ